MILQSKLRLGVLLCLVLPLSVLFALLNIGIYRHYRALNEQQLDALAHEAAAQLERILSAEALRLQNLALMPNVDQLISVADRSTRNLSMAGRRERAREVDERWQTIGLEDAVVRNTLNNSVSVMFSHLVEHDANLLRLYLTDRAGALLAASQKPSSYDYGDADWWALARTQGARRVVSEGVTDRGRVGLAVAVEVTPDEETKEFRGVLRSELGLARALRGVDWSSDETDWSMVVRCGVGDWLMAGHSLDEERAGWLTGELPEHRGHGWREGYRYAVRDFMPGISWLRGAELVVMRPQSQFPKEVFGPMAVGVLVSLTILIGSAYFALSTGKRVFFDPFSRELEAGYWVIRNALGDEELSRRAQLAAGSDVIHLEMRQKLEGWMATVEDEARKSGQTISNEMQTDLDLARDFQMAYLNRPYPKIPEVHYEGRLRLRFYHRYKPAMVLGGDFFDLIPLASDTAGVFVADVMGHGARSALITAILRTLIRDLSAQGRNAPHFIAELNRQFCRTLQSFPSTLFASAFYFVPDTTTRVATFSTAGHPAPFHIRRSVGRISRLEGPPPAGAALGILPDEKYTGGHVRLQAGDVFIFFTDGIYEASNKAGEEFGLKRMEQVFKTTMYKKAETLVDALLNAVTQFAGNQPIGDDLCVVAVEVTTAAETPDESGLTPAKTTQDA